MRLFALLLSIAIGLQFNRAAYAKCAADRYLIAGRLKEYGSGLPLRNAKVFVFFDDDEVSSGPASRKANSYFTSSADGSFQVTTYMDTLKDPDAPLGPGGRHDCSKVAIKLELFVLKAGYYPTRQEFTKLKIVERGAHKKFIELPEITVERLRRR